MKLAYEPCRLEIVEISGEEVILTSPLDPNDDRGWTDWV